MPRHSLWKNCHIRTDRASVRIAGECKTGRVCAEPGQAGRRHSRSPGGECQRNLERGGGIRDGGYAEAAFGKRRRDCSIHAVRMAGGPEKGWVAQYNGRSNAVSTDIRVLGDIGGRGYYENYYFTSEKNEY